MGLIESAYKVWQRLNSIYEQSSDSDLIGSRRNSLQQRKTSDNDQSCHKSSANIPRFSKRDDEGTESESASIAVNAKNYLYTASKIWYLPTNMGNDQPEEEVNGCADVTVSDGRD